METPAKTHPLILIAAGAVTLAALTASAHFLGWLPAADAPVPVAASSTSTTTLASVTSTTLPPAADSKPVTRRPASTAPARKAQADTAEQRSSVASISTSTQALCAQCGVVENVREIETRGEGSGLGAIAGGVIGGLLGNQVGKGGGKKAATVIGGVGGALAGHQIEKSVKSEKSREVTLLMEDGSRRKMTVAQDHWRIGDRVRIVDGTLQAR